MIIRHNKVGNEIIDLAQLVFTSAIQRLNFYLCLVTNKITNAWSQKRK